MPTIWTIGHSTHTAEHFLTLLQQANIELLADVRRYPGSRRLPWTLSATLAETLAGQGIGYLHMPALGGRRQAHTDSINTAWRNAGFRGYADHMGTEEFTVALEKLKEMALAHRTAIMCAERHWTQCHRGLIADRLKAEGWTVLHILPDRILEHVYTEPAHIVDGRLTYGEQTLL
ncbi:MAG TPA: DUF488 domain-containing protein [Flavobacteriales bacterium]|jgi:uncharacterized protein (DUF488 family)|nr:DUF488 domain-containing protein [Flavobacteriales bacterium]